MLQSWLLGPDGLVPGSASVPVAPSPDAAQVVWVDLVDPGEDELDEVCARFGIHPARRRDLAAPGRRPKLEIAADYAELVGYAHDPDPLDLPLVVAFVGARWLVTVRARNGAGRAFDVGPVQQRVAAEPGRVDGPGWLLYLLLDDMIDGYFDTIEAAEDRLESVEAALFERDGAQDGDRAFDDRVQGELLALRRVLIGLRRRIVPMRDALLGVLRGEIPWLTAADLLELQHVLDRLLRVVDELDTQRELLGNVVEAHLGLVANRTNEVMKKTSSWGAILIVATLIAGIYGMNFANMPELSWRYGYVGALATMLIVTTGLYLYFKRKGWL